MENELKGGDRPEDCYIKTQERPNVMMMMVGVTLMKEGDLPLRMHLPAESQHFLSL